MGKISIGGKEFFGSAEFMLDADTVTSDQPGDDSSFITDMGVGPLTIRVRGDCTEETDNLSDVRKEIMTVGELSLILDSGWKYKVFRQSFRPVRVAGTKQTGLNGYHNEFYAVFVCEEPYQFSTPTACRAKAITSNNQEWSAEDMLCDNLLDNWSLEEWSGGVSGVNPNGWTTTRPAANYPARESTHIKTGTYSAAMKWNGVGSNSIFRQTLTGLDVSNSVGKTVTFGVWVKASAATKTFIQIYDGTTAYNSSYNSGTGWEFLEVSCTIDSSATSILLTVDVRDDTNEVYIDGAVYVIDSSIIDSTFSRSISTDGEVDAVPDIQVTGNVGGSTADQTCAGAVTDLYHVKSAQTVGQTVTFSSTAGDKFVSMNATFSGGSVSFGDVTLKVYDSPSKNTLLGSKTLNIPSGGTYTFTFSTPTVIEPDTQYYCVFNHEGSTDVSIYAINNTYGGGALYLNDVIQAAKDLIFVAYVSKDITIDPQVYNTADSTIKCDVANDVLYPAVHRINSDGTGTIDFDSDFTDGKYSVGMTSVNTTHDSTNDEIDIADDGYIYWAIDTKYPITGIPTLTSQINNTAATLPTIQISTDAATWYDIDTVVVDDVDTEYELDDSTNLSLKGQTSFYFRIDCATAAVVQGCSVKSFELDVDIVTIDAENPVITEGGSASTFRCDQDAASSMQATVALIYPDKRWPG